MTKPLCIGHHDLFDSTETADHVRAAELCAACPLLDTCRDEVTAMQAEANVYGHAVGTWAGHLYLTPSHGQARRLAAESRAERIAREEAAWDDDEARRAHTAYTAGQRDEWARTGHRIYDRRRKRGDLKLLREAS